MTRFPKALLVLALAGVGAAASASEITVGVYSAFTTLDPYDASDTLSQNVAKSFYEGLFGFDKDMKLQNVLAESYEVSDDGLVYTVKLRKGVKSATANPSTPLRSRRISSASSIPTSTSPATRSTRTSTALRRSTNTPSNSI